MPLKQVEILGVNVNSLTMAQAVEAVQQFIAEKKVALVATANAEMLMRSTQDEELKDILNQADLVVPDGAGTVWAAGHLGEPMPERVAGFDLAQELMREAPARGDRIYFFGSAPGVADKAKAKAEELYPGIQVVGTRNGFFTEADEPGIIAEIKAARPDILLAALGVPKQEKWLKKHMQELQVPVSIGVGGTLDVMAGVMERAPLWMQKAKLEWLFRGLKQPSRAGRLLALPKFVLKVVASKK
ncbi:MAG: WecB/TagA/CpsF family glycosyltransferase [Selenomonadaceae bacterium]|uniref:N-acetylglucosaminyldiphosphoundecaprenol N-acetyl-beta-D-mannosaminyltransferase n=1 Tax=Anaerovibrio slackiae TaxID=2652309 RepID=A0A6I2UE12_9FIRM|nr:WecB/TagA/CpsF family glycosyltransferase [Anaerovibrio slackiae]MBQ2009501.1 WecB/TagA/CpsF family glycosyltransferase [Selenomonadaceae bacterium]MBQ2411685.1 WecB/TagA/CpsF family glycosyltransferase [Selenomonadaceae bacterium]MBQ5585987.1 WecB/TagA/CpsF family glycosyltransferase [Selenomonadaceae bacterium]MBQ5650500.1 WecB/TagA/CpsF family glycosyltransferase [Selenomonadaceae bacterium]MBQ5732365.1 WecB/TagA/CpsF family glycosyltransferase [Selenomonadaceae bacterium]